MKKFFTILTGTLFLTNCFFSFSATAEIYPTTTIQSVKQNSFNAVVTEKSVILNWITENETANSHFEMERSFNGTDFTSIGIALDGFDNDAEKAYAFKDNAALLQEVKVIYYRLKQTDITGKTAYSNTLTVRLKNADVASMQLSPNPFTEQVLLSFNSEVKGNAEIRITNITGQQMMAKTSFVNKGNNNFQLEGLSFLPSGVYIASLIMNGKITNNLKIIK